MALTDSLKKNKFCKDTKQLFGLIYRFQYLKKIYKMFICLQKTAEGGEIGKLRGMRTLTICDQRAD